MIERRFYNCFESLRAFTFPPGILIFSSMSSIRNFLSNLAVNSSQERVKLTKWAPLVSYKSDYLPLSSRLFIDMRHLTFDRNTWNFRIVLSVTLHCPYLSWNTKERGELLPVIRFIPFLWTLTFERWHVHGRDGFAPIALAFRRFPTATSFWASAGSIACWIR